MFLYSANAFYELLPRIRLMMTHNFYILRLLQKFFKCKLTNFCIIFKYLVKLIDIDMPIGTYTAIILKIYN